MQSSANVGPSPASGRLRPSLRDRRGSSPGPPRNRSLWAIAASIPPAAFPLLLDVERGTAIDGEGNAGGEVSDGGNRPPAQHLIHHAVRAAQELAALAHRNIQHKG